MTKKIKKTDESIRRINNIMNEVSDMNKILDKCDTLIRLNLYDEVITDEFTDGALTIQMDMATEKLKEINRRFENL